MKRITTTLYISLALILLGIILATVGLAVNGFNFKKFDMTKIEEKTFAVSAPFTSVSVETGATDVRFAPSQTGAGASVVSRVDKKIQYSVEVVNGVLTVTRKDTRKWYDYIGIRFAKQYVTVYLPEGEYQNLTVTGTTGDVTVPSNFTFATVNVKMSTGDIRYSASAKNVSLEVTTGDISFTGNAESVRIKGTTGDYAVRRATVTEGITVNATTGDVEMENVTAQTLAISLSTGEVDLNNVLTVGKTEITARTGDVELSYCDAGEYNVKTTTGDVEMSLLTPKIYNV
ncbi:MAG: DUF4097 family beta strand repeat protein, partial [Clostridia bacterium]|nr:DUF4097 family beta strand repeat protein [Clostridia bacterium]